MYQRILVAIEHSKADAAILEHIEKLARLTGAMLLLVHVADGLAARHFDDLNLRESEEIKEDRAYLAERCDELRRPGLTVRYVWPWAIPPPSSSGSPNEEKVDLIAMSTHGHRFLSDVIHGTTVDRVRHTVMVPVLLLRGQTMTCTSRASAPTRIDLAGGTLDIWPIYLFHQNAQTLNAAISLRAHAEILPADGRQTPARVDRHGSVARSRELGRTSRRQTSCRCSRKLALFLSRRATSRCARAANRRRARASRDPRR